MNISKYTSNSWYIQIVLPWFCIELGYHLPDFLIQGIRSGISIEWGKTDNKWHDGSKAYKYGWEWMKRITAEQLEELNEQ